MYKPAIDVLDLSSVPSENPNAFAASALICISFYRYKKSTANRFNETGMSEPAAG
jgi:hypothetical protein